MGLNPGTRLGPYEILSPIGAGGMGEVYRARDTRLDRTVAVKVIPSYLSSNPDLRQRFEREAKSISQLQHANICTLFDVGSQDGVDYLVMEYLEGETLADRLKRGPLPLPQLLRAGIELAEALEKAHHAGLIHRDLKPGNIMLTKSGAKLLDFGLAKPLAVPAGATGSGSSPQAGATGLGSSPLLSAALTRSSPAAALTSVGSVVGTVQYMSPEQIGGHEADARSDIFCFGAVLYEAAAGKPAFDGKTQSKIVGAILANDPPPVSSLQSSVPPAFDRVVQTCLAKDPEERFESAHDLKLQLEWVRDFGTGEPSTTRTTASPRLWKYIAAGVGLALLIVSAFLLYRPQPSSQIIRAEISPPPGKAFFSIGDTAGAPVLSPQGDQIAFIAAGPDNVQSLWVRRLDGLAAQKIEGTEGLAPSHPFWSPDGKYIGFFTASKVNKVPATGGPIVSIADVTNARGGTWGKDNIIVYAPDFRFSLMQVSAQGGTPTAATTIDLKKHTTHRWPYFMPDGKHFIYFATNHGGGRADENGIYFASLDGKENHFVLTTDSAAEYASGYLLCRSQTALVAQPFDPSSGKLSGTPIRLINNVRYDAGVWRTVFSVSQNGNIIYQPSTASGAGTQLALYDRSGKLLKNLGDKEQQSDVRISPDGKKIALLKGDPHWEIWVLDLERAGQTRITYSQGTPQGPAWYPDGKTLVYTMLSGTGSLFDIRSKPANGNGAEKTITSDPHFYTFPGITPDGKYLTYVWGQGGKGSTLWAQALDGDKAPVKVIQPPAPDLNIVMYRISPDGKWVAYVSDETGRVETYLAPYPKADGKWQISNFGGAYPVWRADGKELFIKGFNDQLYSVSFEAKGDEPHTGQPQPLFRANMFGTGMPYDVTADGQRFIINKSEEAVGAPLYLEVNWLSDLKKE